MLLILQLILKKLLDKLIFLVLTLQIAQSYGLYNLSAKLPANLQIFLAYIKEVIDFEYLKIDKILIVLFPEKFEFEGVFKAPDLPVEIGIKNGSIFENLSNIIVMVCTFILFVLILLLAKVMIRKYRKNIGKI